MSREPKYDLYPTVHLPEPPQGAFGWIPSSPEEKEKHERLYPLSLMGWEVAEAIEKRLYVPITETSGGVTTNLVTYIDQGSNGTCGGFSAVWGGVVRNSTPAEARKYSGVGMYKLIRKAMGANPDDLNGGVTMPGMGKALVNYGMPRTIGKVVQPADVAEGIVKFVWGTSALDARLAISKDKPVQLGIYWYQAFQSPKLINGEYWIGWQSTSSWGSVLGGHAIIIIERSDSKGAFRLKNTWGADYPEVWISDSAINYLLRKQGEMMICDDRPPVSPIPVGKLELVEALEIQPPLPVLGDNIVASFVVKNTGNAVLSLLNIGVRGLRNGSENWDFGMQPLTLDVGQAVELAPKCNKPLEVGSYTFTVGYQDTKGWYNLGTPVSFIVKQAPLGQATADIEVTIDGVVYGAKDVVLTK